MKKMVLMLVVMMIRIIATKENIDIELPASYDYRETGQQSVIKDQGESGACWALAATTALETRLKPEEDLIFSADHISMYNGFGIEMSNGGNSMMTGAYLLSWKGPVLEEADPFGDGYSPEDLAAAKHVQEIQYLKDADRDEIKKAIYLYGGVESAFYFDLLNEYTTSEYYNVEAKAYCYQGETEPNHDVVIIGWDDEYPAENFTLPVEGNGAFICQNSWGESFGDNGVFYVSYYDSWLGKDGVVYSGIEDVTNYDMIYQSDLCGWLGRLGYDSSEAYMANVYTASEDMTISAVGFYATGPMTEYEVYFVSDVQEEVSPELVDPIAWGTKQNMGYYTIPLTWEQEVLSGERFAVVVKINTPESRQPVAIESETDYDAAVDLADGEGYISADGKVWISTEKEQNCNICLKAYGKNMQNRSRK